MIPDTNWTPTPTDIAWQQNMIRILKDNAIWGVPASESAFKINKGDKLFQFIGGDPAHETNRRIAKVFKLLGYSEAAPTGPLVADEEPPTQKAIDG